MPATIVARRSANGWDYGLQATVLPCLRDHPRAAAASLRLIVDSGSARTHVRGASVRGVEARWTTGVYGLTGAEARAAKLPRVHFLFRSQSGPDQILTTATLLVDAADAKEDGLLGLDLVRSMELHGPRAIVTLAGSDEEAESYARPAAMPTITREIRQLTALMEIRNCGCEAALKGTRR